MERLHSARGPQSTLYGYAVPHVRASPRLYTCLPKEEGHSNGFDVGNSLRDRYIGCFCGLRSCGHHHADRCCQDEDYAQRCGQ